ncbi:MAG TPA: lactate racemase domain-containing protein [Pirellulales bacterium]|nr:lactate racemase domain-containing protein [Pirellulales bacterium]
MIQATMQIPQVFRIRQQFPRVQVDDVASEVRNQLAGLKLEEKIKPGQSVAITAGSRGIANIHLIVRAAVQYFQSLGAKPFIVPSMGSHAGATAEGQQRMIESFGITEAFCGCPIRASMETVVVCETAQGFPIYFDRQAFTADHVLVCGRVKPHTDFAGEIESGLMKMMLIGLGNHDGAKIYHRAFQDYTFSEIVESVGRIVLARCPIVAGLAIVENGYEETAKIEAVLPADFLTREKALLVLARELLPRLPLDRLDLLVVDEMGKNVSGTGMDTNVIGRKFNESEALPDEFPKVRRIAVRGLTEATHGNALGIGMAEFCTRRLFSQIDFRSLTINCLTSGRMACAKVPLAFDNDRQMIEAALSTVGLVEPAQSRILWIRNTRELLELECSAVLLDEMRAHENVEVVSGLRDFPFEDSGDLPTAGIHFPTLTGGLSQRSPAAARH